MSLHRFKPLTRTPFRRVPPELSRTNALKYDPRERFLLLVRKDEDGCWRWQGTLDRLGYGKFGVGGKQYLAHRWFYQVERGPVHPKLQMDHLCRVHECVNPDHLEPVTPKVNGARGMKATKTHCARGHEFTPENTYRRPNGRRYCRRCHSSDNTERERRQRAQGKPARRGWRHLGPAGTGACIYCDRWRKLTHDHVIPRSIAAGADWTHDIRNMVLACWECNSGRGAGLKPDWGRLPVDTRAFVIEKLGAFRAGRYFTGVPQPAEEAS